MRGNILFFLLMLFFNLNFGQSKFESFIKYLNSLPYNQKDIVVDSFFAASSQKGIPLVEENTVYFLYLGQSDKVFVTGDFNEWDKNYTLMAKVPGTDLQYLKRKLSPDSCIQYMIKDNEGVWQKDIYNPNYQVKNNGIKISVLEMPGYIRSEKMNYFNESTKRKIDTSNNKSKSTGIQNNKL